jgi:hypothetical protein
VSGDERISGRYVVTSKVTYIENFNFYQKVEACRHGMNDQKSKSQL